MNENRFSEAGEVFVAADKFPILNDITPKESDGKLDDEQMGQIDAAIATAQAAKPESKPVDLYKALLQTRINRDTPFQNQALSGRQRYDGQGFDGVDQWRLKGPGETPQLFDSKYQLYSKERMALMFPLFEDYKQAKDVAEQTRETAFQLMMQKLFSLIKASENPQESIALLKENMQKAKDLEKNDQGLSGVKKDSWSNLLEIMKKNGSPTANLGSKPVDFGSGPVKIDESNGRSNFR